MRFIYLTISIITLIICIATRGFISTDDIMEYGKPDFSDKNVFEIVKDFKKEIHKAHPIGFVNREEATTYLIKNLFGITKGHLFEDNKTLLNRYNKFLNEYYRIGFGLHFVNFVTAEYASGATRIQKKFFGIKYYQNVESPIPAGPYIKEGSKSVFVYTFNNLSLIPINLNYYIIYPYFYITLIFFIWSIVFFINSGFSKHKTY